MNTSTLISLSFLGYLILPTQGLIGPTELLYHTYIILHILIDLFFNSLLFLHGIEMFKRRVNKIIKFWILELNLTLYKFPPLPVALLQMTLLVLTLWTLILLKLTLMTGMMRKCSQDIQVEKYH